MHAPHSGGGEFPTLFFLCVCNFTTEVNYFPHISKTSGFDAPHMWHEVTLGVRNTV